jgi:hypothetical protein
MHPGDGTRPAGRDRVEALRFTPSGFRRSDFAPLDAQARRRTRMSFEPRQVLDCPPWAADRGPPSKGGGLARPHRKGFGWAKLAAGCFETRDTHAACPARCVSTTSKGPHRHHARRPRIKARTARTKLLGHRCAARRTTTTPIMQVGEASNRGHAAKLPEPWRSTYRI